MPLPTKCSIHEIHDRWPYEVQCNNAGTYKHRVGDYVIKVCNRHLTLLREARK